MAVCTLPVCLKTHRSSRRKWTTSKWRWPQWNFQWSYRLHIETHSGGVMIPIKSSRQTEKWFQLFQKILWNHFPIWLPGFMGIMWYSIGTDWGVFRLSEAEWGIGLIFLIVHEALSKMHWNYFHWQEKMQLFDQENGFILNILQEIICVFHL